MYAVFKTGGKQYRATQGQKVKLEKINANSGDKIQFTEVLMVGEGSDIEIGTPFLANASVEAKVLEEGKDYIRVGDTIELRNMEEEAS